MTANHVAILAIPRTGTNYLCDLISKFNEIDSLYEIFHKDAVYLGNNEQLRQDVIEHINQEYSLTIEDFRSAAFVNFVSHNPQVLLDIIAQKSEQKYVSFKIFSNHLQREKLRNLIIKNQQITKIIVKRNLLDVYLSKRIAQQTNQWGKSDTSRFKLEFDDNDFMKWFTNQNKYYGFIESELANNNQKINILQYETIHAHQNNQEKFKYLFDFFQSAGLQLDRNNLLNLSQKDLDQNVRKKQDKRKSTLEKLSNPNTLIDALKSYELEFLLA